MMDDNIICSDTLLSINNCTCKKCIRVINMVVDSEGYPEEGTDQARLFDMAMAHLIFPPDKGDSFEDIMKKAQE